MLLAGALDVPFGAEGAVGGCETACGIAVLGTSVLTSAGLAGEDAVPFVWLLGGSIQTGLVKGIRIPCKEVIPELVGGGRSL
jgi:hypothetical protein